MRAIARSLALAIAFATLAGCATGPAQQVREAAPDSAGFSEAHALAKADARANAGRIDQLLSQIESRTLSRHAEALASNDPLYPFVERALLRRGLPSPHGSAWALDLGTRAPAASDGYRPPRRIGMLLPLTGALATAAKPVRDGFLSAYSGERRPRPDITFYDTATGVASAYQQAAADGVDLVVGPLSRDDVDGLFAMNARNVPVIALNRGSRATPAGSVSFALTPEDEAIAAAEWLLANNARRVLVVSGGEGSVRRAEAAFAERFKSRGGEVAATLNAATMGSDAVAAAGAVDAVFFATNGEQAIAATRVLNAAGGPQRRIGTSQIQTGLKDGDVTLLDGIAFPTERWQSLGVEGLPSAAAAAAQTPTARGPAAKLFAFGYDAWLIAAYPERVLRGAMPGATGTLSVDSFGNVQRMPGWSVYRGGSVTPLRN